MVMDRPKRSDIVCQHCHKAEEGSDEAFKKCGQCRLCHYCSRECQRKHWPEHKARCKANAEAQALAEEQLSAKAIEEIGAWVMRNRPLLTAVAVGLLCPSLGITSPANCKQELLTQAVFGLAVTYCKDGSFKIDLENAPAPSPAVKELIAQEAAKKVPTFAEDERLVFAYISFSIEGNPGRTVGGSGPDPMIRLVPLGFKLGLLEKYIKNKSMYQQGLIGDELKKV